MPKERKPGWVYVFSDAIKKEYAFHIETGWVYFEDGVMYSPDELRIIGEGGGTLTPAIHNVKLQIGGEIVKNEHGTRTNESGGVAGSGSNSHNAGKVPDNGGDSPEVQSGDYYLF